MRALINICSLCVILYLGWQHHALSEARTEAEARLENLDRHLTETKNMLLAANAQLRAKPALNPNWIDERNKNWKSSLK